MFCRRSTFLTLSLNALERFRSQWSLGSDAAVWLGVSMLDNDFSATVSPGHRVLVNIARMSDEFAVVCAVRDTRHSRSIYTPFSLQIGESNQGLSTSKPVFHRHEKPDSVESIRHVVTLLLVKALTHGCTDQDPFVRHLTIALCAIQDGGRKGQAASSEETKAGGLKPWQKEVAERMLGSDNLSGKPLSDVAHACGLSTPHFGRAFTKSYGVSPHRWLLIQRLEKAKALLMEPEQTMTDIAYECGFFDQSHLSHAFSRRFGQSPGAWRHQHRLRRDAAPLIADIP
ncbi:AraC family transcriptional regulator [Dyella dinghuensis]|uniref:AraC family transcriptional regulator n=2 Tax=Dyella dinghuensis TaxID=1920169 RepID=A0A432LV01_9GAMM|nr:AraC family transcriptional regulator [Dyella dinghuensis]